MENNNEYENYTLAELWDLLEKGEERLKELLAAPVNYYTAGDSMTYLSAMSQCWGIQGAKDEIREIEAEISRRCRSSDVEAHDND